MIREGRLAGTGVLSLIALKRDFVRLVIWWFAIVGTLAASVPALDQIISTDAQRAAHAAFMRTPLGVMMAGPGYGLEDLTLGPLVVAEYLQVVLIAVAMLSILTVVRHTRAEEDSGRAELVRAGAVGRESGLAAAATLLVGINLLIGAGISAALAATGLGGADAFAMGLGVALTGIAFGGIAAVTSQFFSQARSASGSAFYVMTALFVARTFGDIADVAALSWISPFAWTQRLRLYADLRWWPLALYLVVIVISFGSAFAHQSQRDLGAGLMAARSGKANASPLLRGPISLLCKLQRGAVFGWSIGIFLSVFLIGLAANSIQDLIASSPELLVVLGGDVENLFNGYFALLINYVSMAAAGFAIASALMMRSQEEAGLAGMALAGGISRWRWFGAGIITTILGTTVLMLIGGLGLGLSAWYVDGDSNWMATMLVAAIAQLPAPLVFAGFAFLLAGLLPLRTGIVWGIFGIAALISSFGAMFDFPNWTLDLSPFEFLAKLPLEDFELMPVLVISALATLFAFVGMAAFRRRDLTEG